jgi:peptide/nickel transport system substrate-binding protein
MFKKRWNALLALMMITSLVLPACGGSSKVEVTRVVKETVIVEGTPVVQEVTKVVEVEVEKETPVQKETGIITATPEPAPTVVPPLSDEPVSGGTLDIAWRRTGWLAWDLHTSSEGFSRDILLSVLDTLVAYGEDYSIVPSLAESWDISDDGKTYTFHLRRGVKFHDGTDFSAEDVIASLDRYLEVGGRKAQVAARLESYEAVDDYTIVMNIAEPVVSFLDLLATPGFGIAIYPKEIIEGRGDDLTPEEIVGTGPYRVDEWEVGEVVRLARFEDYVPYPGERDGAAGAKIAYFDEINFHTVPEFGAELAGLQTGEYDIIWDSDYGSANIIEADPNLKTIWNKHGGTLFGNFVFGQPWMDLKFRQAVQAGVDMEALGLAATGSCPDCIALEASIWPEFSTWHVDDAPYQELYNQHDLEKAKALLAESSYDGEEFEILSVSYFPHWSNGARELVDQLTEMGITAKITEYGDGALFVSRLSLDAEDPKPAFFFASMLTPVLVSPEWLATFWSCDPSYIVSPHYCSDEMEAALDDLLTAENVEEKKQALLEMERIMYEDAAFFPAFGIGSPMFARSDIMGFESWYTNRFHGVWRAQSE